MDTAAVLRLVTIPISHYCEKARWALDRAGVPYREERHVQGIHQLAARRAGGGRTVPVLVTPEGAIGESEEIIAWVDERTPGERRLLASDPGLRAEEREVCRRLDEELGPRARRLMYVHMLDVERDLALRFNNAGVPGWENRALRWAWPLASRYVKRELGIEPGVEVGDEAAVWRELDWVAELLANGAHLCGKRFGAADLTFAALAAAITFPPHYGVALPQPDVLPARTAALVERARAHPAGRYAMELFATERRGIV
jgi:glutathione S-transferase